MSKLAEVLAAHQHQYMRNGRLPYWCQKCLCDFATAADFARHQAEVVAAAGLAVVPARVVNGVIKSFRDVEGLQLYDAATHGWIDLLAEQVTP